MAADEKRELKEIVGVALGATHLESTQGEEHAIERIGALGLAACRHVDDGPAAPMLGGKAKLEITLDGRLGELLHRFKYGGDRTVRQEAAILLLRVVQESSHRRRWFAWPGQLLMRFCVRVLDEWESEACGNCDGVGRIGVSSDGALLKLIACATCDAIGTVPIREAVIRSWPFLTAMHWPRSGDARRAQLREEAKPTRARCPTCNGRQTMVHKIPTPTSIGKLCPRCGGSGQGKPQHARRALALGIDRDVYWKHWRGRFEWVLFHLYLVDELINRRLHSQLERRKVRAT
jgi:hypothetical protein